MQCPHCGAVNPDGASYCNLCMSRFETNQPASPVPPQWPASVQGSAPMIAPSDVYAGNETFGARKTMPRRMLPTFVSYMIILVILAGLVVGGILIYPRLTAHGTAGVYVRETNKSDSLTLDSDNTFTLHEAGITASGTYAINGTTITLTPTDPAGLSGRNGTVSGNTLIDPGGERWTK
jgi:hypothetical protein